MEQEETHPMAFAASSDPDTMYYHEAMQQVDADRFREAMEKEIQAHQRNKHWTIVHRSTIPKGHKPLSAVWSMKQKREIQTQQVYK